MMLTRAFYSLFLLISFSCCAMRNEINFCVESLVHKFGQLEDPKCTLSRKELMAKIDEQVAACSKLDATILDLAFGAAVDKADRNAASAIKHYQLLPVITRDIQKKVFIKICACWWAQPELAFCWAKLFMIAAGESNGPTAY